MVLILSTSIPKNSFVFTLALGMDIKDIKKDV